jgi:hypothetical protein
VAEVSVAGSIGSLKMALMLPFKDTSLAELLGTVDMTLGAAGGPVVLESPQPMAEVSNSRATPAITK